MKEREIMLARAQDDYRQSRWEARNNLRRSRARTLCAHTLHGRRCPQEFPGCLSAALRSIEYGIHDHVSMWLRADKSRLIVGHSYMPRTDVMMTLDLYCAEEAPLPVKWEIPEDPEDHWYGYGTITWYLTAGEAQ